MNNERRKILKEVLSTFSTLRQDKIGGTQALEKLRQCHEDIAECLFDEQDCLEKAVEFSARSKRVDVHEEAVFHMECADEEILIAISGLEGGTLNTYEDIDVYVSFAIDRIKLAIK